jgi:hypothetical protein
MKALWWLAIPMLMFTRCLAHAASASLFDGAVA